MDNLWRSLSQRVEARLGRSLPELAPDAAADPEFLALLHQLRQVDPDLAEEVISAFTGTRERLPSEAEAAAQRRRQRVHQRLLARVIRPDGLRTGRVRLNLRKTLNWSAGAVVIFIIIWSIIPKSARVGPPTPRLAPVRSQPVPPSTPPPAAATAPASSPALSPQPPAGPTGADAALSLTVGPPNVPPPAPDDDFRRYVATPPPPPTHSPVIVFEAHPSSSAPPSSVAYPREEAHAGAQGLPVVVHASPTGAASTQAPALVVVYEAGVARASVGAAVVASGGPDVSAKASVPTAPRGQLLEATLLTPVVVASSGGATPALAQIAQGPLQGALLLGQATRSPEGLILIQFNGLIAKDGKEEPLRGVAYDAQIGRLGVAGQVSTMMPGAASALLAATLQTVSDYFKARAQQQQVAITNGFLTITPGTPSLWEGLAAAVARAFAPNASASSGPTMVTRLERGQTLTVLVM